MQNTFRLIPVYRIVVFVPSQHLESVVRAIESVGNERTLVPRPYSRYTNVLWWSYPGVEQYLPGNDADPAEGKHGVLSRNPSVRLEFSIERNETLRDKCLVAIGEKHPWKEPVIHIYEGLETQSLTEQEAKGHRQDTPICPLDT